MVSRVRLGTRATPMALVQAARVQRLLQARHCQLQVETVAMSTRGDRHPGPLAALDDSGVFVRELDEALQDGRVEVSVSCAKDLPPGQERPDGVRVGAVLAREEARDALVWPTGHPGGGLAALPAGARVGTSAPRRIAQLHALRPDVACQPLRGGIDRRLAALDQPAAQPGGGWDALVVAHAGLERLGQQARAHAVLDLGQMVPAAGAGLLVVEYHVRNAHLAPWLAAVEDASARTCFEVERAVLAALEGRCTTPCAIHAAHHQGQLHVHAGVFGPGTPPLHVQRTGPAEAPQQVADAVSRDLIEAGAQTRLSGAP